MCSGCSVATSSSFVFIPLVVWSRGVTCGLVRFASALAGAPRVGIG